MFWTSDLFVDVPVGVTQEDGHTGFLHLPSAVLAFIFLARRIQPFPSLPSSPVKCIKFCVLISRSLLVGHFFIFILFIYFCEEKSQFV